MNWIQLMCRDVPDKVSLIIAPGWINSEITPDGKRIFTKLGQTLLNGNNICMVSNYTPLPGVFRPATAC